MGLGTRGRVRAISRSRSVIHRILQQMKKLAVLILLCSAFASLAISDATPPKDSQFIFARVQFTMGARWLWSFQEEPWHHDYPF